MKAWDLAGIELVTLESAVRHIFAARHITHCATRLGNPEDVKSSLSYDVTSWSEIMPCNKIDKPLSLVVYRFSGNVMTFMTTLRT